MVVYEPSNHDNSISSSIIVIQRPMSRLLVSPLKLSYQMTNFMPTDVTSRYNSACSHCHFLIWSSIHLCVR